MHEKTPEIEEQSRREEEQDDRHPDIAGPCHEPDEHLEAEPLRHADDDGGHQAQDQKRYEDRLGGGAGGECGPDLQEEIEVKTAVQQKEGQEEQAHDYILHRVIHIKWEVERSRINLPLISRSRPSEKTRAPFT